ncbi:hypothetical protein [Janthinobacterium sp.]|uniref:hypothetical protein n=1 Tax=Janthinobacterium sp. TaxID=1871054 RepID=UPI0025BE92B9|nr:hypothetical protein [Janthinobacterium sp.]
MTAVPFIGMQHQSHHQLEQYNIIGSQDGRRPRSFSATGQASAGGGTSPREYEPLVSPASPQRHLFSSAV